jgi:opacity protein-like surface antigen
MAGLNISGIGGIMHWRKVLLVVGLMLSGVSAAHAQKEYEITPFFGGRVGGIIDESAVGNPNVDYLRIKNSENYGIMAGVTFWGNFEGEFMWNRQPTSLSSHNPSDGTLTFLSNMNLDMYQGDILYHFKPSDSKFRPFIVAGLGLSHFGVPPVNGQSVLGFSNRFSFNLGGGVKYFFTPHVGLRLEARWSPTDTTQGQGEFCDEFGNCFPTTITNKAEQGQANIGLIFRFK